MIDGATRMQRLFKITIPNMMPSITICTFLTTRINSFLFDTEFIYKASRRKEINLQTINANIKEGLAVSDMGFKVLRREALNFLSILFHRD